MVVEGPAAGMLLVDMCCGDCLKEMVIDGQKMLPDLQRLLVHNVHLVSRLICNITYYEAVIILRGIFAFTTLTGDPMLAKIDPAIQNPKSDQSVSP